MRHSLLCCLCSLFMAVGAVAAEPFVVTDFDGSQADGYQFYPNSGSDANTFLPSVTTDVMGSKVMRVEWLSKWAGCEFVFKTIDATAYRSIAFDYSCSQVLDKNIFVRLVDKDGNRLYKSFHMQTVVKEANTVYTIRVKIADLKMETRGTAKGVIAATTRVQVGMETEAETFAKPVVFYLDNIRLEP